MSAPGAVSRALEGAQVSAAFDHVAFAAPRLRDLLPLWVDVLGAQFVLGADHPIGWRAVRLALDGRTRLELMEPLQGSDFFGSHFRRTAGAGPHHVTYAVADIAHARSAVTAAGLTVFGYQDENPDWQEFFVHPRSANGVLVQIAAARPKPPPTMTLEDVLAGRGFNGTGVPSP